ncbi:hypothetical protein LC593_11010 [Nostoc sp. CHAB 5844]|nr:hypothetical protein [Nostoc sp. CHAB 5844]
MAVRCAGESLLVIWYFSSVTCQVFNWGDRIKYTNYFVTVFYFNPPQTALVFPKLAVFDAEMSVTSPLPLNTQPVAEITFTALF